MLASVLNGRFKSRLARLGAGTISDLYDQVNQGARSVGETLDQPVVERIVNDIIKKMTERNEGIENADNYAFVAGRQSAIRQKDARINHLPIYDARFKTGSSDLQRAVEEHILRLYGASGPKAGQHIKKANRFRTFVEYFTSELSLSDVAELLDIGHATARDHIQNFRTEMWPHLTEDARWVLTWKLRNVDDREKQVAASERSNPRAERTREYQAQYRDANRERKNELARQYREANREKFKLAAREYRAQQRAKAGLSGWW